MNFRKPLLYSMLFLMGCVYYVSKDNKQEAIVIPLSDEMEVEWVKE